MEGIQYSQRKKEEWKGVYKAKISLKDKKKKNKDKDNTSSLG